MKKRIFVIIMSLIVGSSSVLFAGCNDKKSVSKNPDAVDEDCIDYEGIHEINVTEGTEKLLENGVAKYKIVIPSETEMRVDMATVEFNTLFAQATGTSLDVISDEGLTYDNNDHYISIGHTTLAKSYGLKTDIKELGESGFVIKSDKNTVFLSGAEGYGFGHIYAVYEFLHQTINYEFYYVDEISIDKNVIDITMPVFDIVDVPDFEWRLAGYEEPSNSTLIANRYRQMRRGDNSFMSNGTAGRNSHTLEGWFTPEKFPEHPDWFSNQNNHGSHAHQMCFTCRGNQEEFDAFVDETVNYVRYVLDHHPQAAMFNLGQADGGGWCNCPACLEMYNKYGTNAAATIKWANAVDDKVQKMLKEEYNGRNFMLSIFAYVHTEKAPAKLDENGEYKAIDDSVILNDDMAIMYAPINAASVLPAGDIKNELVMNTGKAWGACASNMYTWLYDTNFHNYMVPFNSFNAMQSKFKAAKSLKSIWIYNQSQFNNKAATGFNRLKMYLDSKLQWNVNLDYQQLIDDFFEHYFKDAAPIMSKYFNELRLQFAENESDPKYDFSTMNYDTLKASYWPKLVLDRWLDYIDEAYVSIEKYKDTDLEMYNKLYDRINLESVTLRYMTIELYKGRFSDEELYSMQIQLKNDCTRLGMTRAFETAYIESIWERWGI